MDGFMDSSSVCQSIQYFGTDWNIYYSMDLYGIL